MKDLMNTHELSEKLAVPEPTIRKWVAKRTIPYFKLGKLVRFRVSEIDTWVMERAVTNYDPRVYTK